MSPPRSRVVIDQNALRDPTGELGREIERAGRESGRLVLIDTAFIEMTKSEQWRITVERSLKLLARRPELVIFGRSVTEVLKEEKAKGAATREPVEDQERTRHLQRLLKDLRRGVGPALSHFANSMPAYRQEMREDYYQDEDNKALVKRFVDYWRGALTREERAALANDVPAQARALMRRDSLQIVVNEMLEADYAGEAVEQLIREQSTSYRFMQAVSGLGLIWDLDGGFAGAAAHKASNDLLDIDYAVTGSYCTRLLTRDTRLTRLHALLRHVVAEGAAP